MSPEGHAHSTGMTWTSEHSGDLWARLSTAGFLQLEALSGAVAVTHETFLIRYPARPPGRRPANDGELRKLSSEDGVVHLLRAPAENEEGASPALSGDKGRHLWVLDPAGIPYILETANVSPPLESGLVKHTNLTGGGLASCGGELWFDTPQATRLFVNGCSGRYGPRAPEQLADAVLVLEALGYDVISFGWDSELNLPAKVLR